MSRKMLFVIIIFLIVIVIIFGIGLFVDTVSVKNGSSNNIEENLTNTMNLSSEYVNDDCINEWQDYSNIIDENSQFVSNNISSENVRYLVKDVDGYIYIYYLDDFNNETLYKETDISTEYLSVEDLDDLEIGIEVKGSKELNQLLEDFE